MKIQLRTKISSYRQWHILPSPQSYFNPSSASLYTVFEKNVYKPLFCNLSGICFMFIICVSAGISHIIVPTILYFYIHTYCAHKKFHTYFVRDCNLTAFLRSYTGPVVHPLLPVMRDPGSIPRGVLMWNRDSPASVFSLHWWPRHDWSLWPCLRQALSRTITRPSSLQCDNPTWSHRALLSRFHACYRSSSGFTTDIVGCWGGTLWSAYNLTAIIHSFTGPPLRFPSWGARVQSPGGVLMWNQDSPASVVSLQFTYF
jgi:hypothetical protein